MPAGSTLAVRAMLLAEGGTLPKGLKQVQGHVIHGLHRNRTDNDPSYYTVHAGLTDLEESWPESCCQLGTASETSFAMVRGCGLVLVRSG